MNAFVTLSAEAAELRESFDAQEMSNPIGIFTCPHCHQAADVEYGLVVPDFPSGRSGRTGADSVDAARCFRCGEVSYWLMIDFDLHNDGGRDWRDFPRVLLYPLTEHLREPWKPQPLTQAPEVLTYSRLSDLYMAEQEGNFAPKSVKDITSSNRVLAKALTDEHGVELNLLRHTREDMVNLKSRLLADGRKPLTVNKLLTRLSTVLTWATNNGYLDRTFNKGLKITKGAESGRKAFTVDQIQKVMDEMGRLPEDNWKRWAMSLGVITGARIGEIYQLTREDIRKIGGITVIDLNEDEGKTLKNKHSRRLVPLVDGAYGFDLEAFLRYMGGCEGRLFDRVAHNFTRVLNETLRDIGQHDSGEGLTYHSLRHSLAGLLKAHAIPVGIAQDILGHSSQTITFDLYGGDQRLALKKLEAALKDVFQGAAL